MKAKKLKPCPFCGKKRIESSELGSFGLVNENPLLILWQVDCKCGAAVIMRGKEKCDRDRDHECRGCHDRQG